MELGSYKTDLGPDFNPEFESGSESVLGDPDSGNGSGSNLDLYPS